MYDDGDCCYKTVNDGIVKTCHLSNQLVDNFCFYFYFIVLFASDLCQISNVYICTAQTDLGVLFDRVTACKNPGSIVRVTTDREVMHVMY